MEDWRPVLGFEGLYEVSNLGCVRSVQREVPYGRHGKTTYAQKTLKQFASKNKYLCVKLSCAGRTNTVYVHQLVIKAFGSAKPISPERIEIRHLDGNRLNNRAENLLYGTVKENALDRVRHAKERNYTCKGATR